MNYPKISLTILAIACALNTGAFILTNIGLAQGFAEGNGTMAVLYRIGPAAVFAACVGVYILLYITQKRLINRAPVLWPSHPNFIMLSIPIIAFVLFGLDFTHDIGVIFFDVHLFGWIAYFFVWNQFLM